MLFFFELGLFFLAMLTLGLGEVAGRGAALGLWLACTAASLLGYVAARRGLARMLHSPTAGSEDADARRAELDARWARTLLYTWRRTNALLLLGLAVVGGWYWLGNTV